jgi:hypothetical protein
MPPIISLGRRTPRAVYPTNTHPARSIIINTLASAAGGSGGGMGIIINDIQNRFFSNFFFSFFEGFFSFLLFTRFFCFF